MTSSKKTLSFAAYLSFAVAIFQAGISFSPSLSQYFGAPEQLVANRLLLILAGLFMAVVFVIFGLYALSGAGSIRRLPLLRGGLLVIGGIYSLRGLILIPQWLIFMRIFSSYEIIGIQSLVSSLVALFIGLVYLFGTLNFRHSIKPI
jgi:hypothetical protein